MSIRTDLSPKSSIFEVHKTAVVATAAGSMSLETEYHHHLVVVVVTAPLPVDY